jgi:hypothetical protein
MAIVTLKDAGLLSGKGSATIYRHIKSGKLSKTGDGVDTSELIRVYGELKEIVSSDKDDNYQNDKKDVINDNDKLSSLEREIELLRETVTELRNDKQELYTTIKFYQSMLPAPIKNTEAVNSVEPEEKKKGFFKRLFFI